jgi:hypothetical protein
LLVSTAAFGLVVTVESPAGRYVWVGEDRWGNTPLDLDVKTEPLRIDGHPNAL